MHSTQQPGLTARILTISAESYARDSVVTHTQHRERSCQMKVFSANIQDFRTLYVSNLKKALDMEQKILKALPDLIAKTSDPELAKAFEIHLHETGGHVE